MYMYWACKQAHLWEFGTNQQEKIKKNSHKWAYLQARSCTPNLLKYPGQGGESLYMSSYLEKVSKPKIYRFLHLCNE